jgi:hypothetical protein
MIRTMATIALVACAGAAADAAERQPAQSGVAAAPPVFTPSSQIQRRDKRMARVTPAGGGLLATGLGLQLAGIVKVEQRPDYSGHRTPGDRRDSDTEGLAPLVLKLPAGMK